MAATSYKNATRTSTWAVAATVASKVIHDLEQPVDDFKRYSLVVTRARGDYPGLQQLKKPYDFN